MMSTSSFRSKLFDTVGENLNRLPQGSVISDSVQLTGYVKGKKASDLEERFALGLIRAELPFYFQVEIQTANHLPWEAKVIDFLVHHGLYYPIEVNGEYWHEMGGKRCEDELRETLLNEAFRRMGFQPLQIVWYYEIQTQYQFDNKVGELFL